ncbi:MAG: hypothetical protein IKX13_06760 [Bacteroidales bacterium]|jgi:hypothetical protein|nr:hypothetical protein [Bacteroidales bacterium]MBQ2489864.1 hypothetical protein [Bacteroidales bacterium]MBR5665434.1 hypothetical protein [Bacteroidales bacterium]MCR5190646.1 hypothetical protein [Bacteroidales bacterium]
MIRKTISVTMVFLGTFGVFYSANTGDYGWTLLCGALVILGALILKKKNR